MILPEAPFPLSHFPEFSEAGFSEAGFPDPLPRRYFVDGDGARVLIGLSIEETREFEAIDTRPARREPDDIASTAAPLMPGDALWGETAGSAAARQTRWLELYRKHDAAWRRWLRETAAGDLPHLVKINQDGLI
jgi:hypothetical protein